MIIEKIQRYKWHEQLALLLSRASIDDEVTMYIQEVIDRPDIDWNSFLGIAFNNRLNGVIYANISKYKNVPSKTKFILNLVYTAQLERNEIHQKEIDLIFEGLEETKIKYAFLKGAVLNTLFYSCGERISNDTDIMVTVASLNKCTEVLKRLGYQQGDVVDGKFVPATKMEKLFARMNTYEIVPFIKMTNNSYFKFHEVDINFKLSNDEMDGVSENILNETIVLKSGNKCIRTMSVENFLLYLCIHLYREATMILKIKMGEDLTLYKFMDIHFYVIKKKEDIDWDKLYTNSVVLGRTKEVWYALYYTELLYPGTINSEILERFKQNDDSILNEYKGRDNSDEKFLWKEDFTTRVFNWSRKSEAFENIKEESNRFSNIIEQLKME